MVVRLGNDSLWVLRDIARRGRLVAFDAADGTTTAFDGRFGEALQGLIDARAATPAAERLARFAAATPQGRTLGRILANAADLQPATAADLVLRGQPSLCFVELTSRCNERCAHCYAGSGPEMTDALDHDTLAAVVEDVATLGFRRIQFTGGDPLISQDLVPLARQAHALGIPAIEVYTNALALYAPLLRDLLDVGATFAVSLYSHDAATHDSITRVPKSHQRTIANVKRAVAEGAFVRVSVVLMESNRGHYPATRDFIVNELGVPADRIGVDVVHTVGRGETIPGLDPGPDVEIDSRNAHGGFGGLPAEPAAAASSDNPGPFAHESAWSGKLAVAPTGDVFPCVFSRFVSLGSVKQRRLTELLANPEIRWDDEATAALGTGADLDAQLAWLGDRLQCHDCRLGTAALVAAGAAMSGAGR